MKPGRLDMDNLEAMAMLLAVLAYYTYATSDHGHARAVAAQTQPQICPLIVLINDTDN